MVTRISRIVDGRKFDIDVADEQYVEVTVLDAQGNRQNVCREPIMPQPMRTARYMMRLARQVADFAFKGEDRMTIEQFLATVEREAEANLKSWGVRTDRVDLLKEQI